MPALSDAVALALAIVVHVREAAEQMAVLVAERADAEIGWRAAEAGQQIEVGPHGAEAQVDVPVVRPELATILGLARVHHVERVDDVLVARVELLEVEAVRDRKLQRLFDQQVVDVELAVPAERDTGRRRRSCSRACRSIRARNTRGRSRCCRCACSWRRSASRRRRRA